MKIQVGSYSIEVDNEGDVLVSEVNGVRVRAGGGFFGAAIGRLIAELDERRNTNAIELLELRAEVARVQAKYEALLVDRNQIHGERDQLQGVRDALALDLKRMIDARAQVATECAELRETNEVLAKGEAEQVDRACRAEQDWAAYRHTVASSLGLHPNASQSDAIAAIQALIRTRSQFEQAQEVGQANDAARARVVQELERQLGEANAALQQAASQHRSKPYPILQGALSTANAQTRKVERDLNDLRSRHVEQGNKLNDRNVEIARFLRSVETHLVGVEKSLDGAAKRFQQLRELAGSAEPLRRRLDNIREALEVAGVRSLVRAWDLATDD
jgi:DNA repair exonuclease SbcCD ATPase subunit